MSVAIGINGYGRIGRTLHRVLPTRSPSAGVAVGGVNDHPAAEAAILAFMLEHDSVYGGLGQPAEGADGSLSINGSSVEVFGCAEPTQVRWETAGVEVVIESSGHFRRRGQAAGHLRGDVYHVVISAPSPMPT